MMTWGVILIVPDALVNLIPHFIQPYPPWFMMPVYKLKDFSLPNGAPITP